MSDYFYLTATYKDEVQTAGPLEVSDRSYWFSGGFLTGMLAERHRGDDGFAAEDVVLSVSATNPQEPPAAEEQPEVEPTLLSVVTEAALTVTHPDGSTD
jgi:hypothetical protein